MTTIHEYTQALDLVLKHAPGPKTVEHIPLDEAFGRILAEPAVCDVDLPPFDRSAMDGFAVCAADVEKTPTTLEVVMDIPAGKMPQGQIKSGQAASIMTGAPLPKGADTVVMVEWTSGFGEKTVTINQGVGVGNFVNPRSQILQADTPVLEKGTWIRATEISLLAAAGCDRIPVFSRPSAAILSTGDEIVPPSVIPGPAQIRDSNGPALTGFLRGYGLNPVRLGCVPDDLEATAAVIKEGLEHDLLLITGGVSAGSYDFVKDIMEKFQVDIHFRKLAVKPGHPTMFGTHSDKMVFGLPGNPISATVLSRMLVAPALNRRLGRNQCKPRFVRARLVGTISKKPDRLWFVHGQLNFEDEVTVLPIANHGSSDIPAATRGNCLIVAPKGLSQIESNTIVNVAIWDRSL
jgi:molybdopterin molybdotransferase